MPRSETLFIADLHLDPARPAGLALVHRFLAERAAGCEALYILGDLFEAWVGDDDDTPAYREVIAALAQLADSGTRLAFLPGNRDFLAGDAFAAAAHCELLADPTRVELYGTPTLLAHGDLLCTDDLRYQAFRAQSRDPQWRAAFLAQPLAERHRVAAALREQSREETGGKSLAEMDVNPAAVAAALAERGAHRLIHGHIHREGFHHEGEAERWVVGDWGERGSLLACTPDGCRFESFP